MVDRRKSSYSVGFKRAPKHTRFQKGKSGNPRGRPKGSLNVATTLRKALSAPVKVIERGKSKTMTKLEVAIQQQTNKAAAGDGQALKLLSQLLREADDGGATTKDPITIVITEEEAKCC
jgi:Family of unknown function (DUF5681)